MVRTHPQTQQKVLGLFGALAYEQGRSRVLVPSLGWMREQTGMHAYTVRDAIAWLEALRKIAVERNQDGSLWIDLAPNRQQGDA